MRPGRRLHRPPPFRSVVAVKASFRCLGVDLDNTIIRYDEAFYSAAVTRGWIDAATPRTKTAVKNAVFCRHGNREWTELQGFVYGPGIEAATPFPGVLDFFASAARQGVRIYIISHKTRHAAEGPPYDLRQAAMHWLEARGWFDPARGGLTPGQVLFADSRAAKVQTVCDLGCDVLIDDLPEVFQEPQFPRTARFILFDPEGAYPEWTASPRAATWAGIAAEVFP
jgi:hypothetical protein